MAEPLVAAPSRYVLQAGTILLDTSPELICRALLLYADDTTEVLLYGPDGGQIRPGRWHAEREAGMYLVRYELVEGPVPEATFDLYADALEGGTCLRCEGAYAAPRTSLFGRRRPHQLAEALRAGLLLSLQHALTNMRDLGLEQRAAARRVFDMPARLRVGDQPWAGITRDISTTGIGMFVHAAPGEAHQVADRIAAHGVGAVELLVGDARLITRVEVLRACPQVDGVDVGLRFTNPAESARFVQRLAALGLWDDPADRDIPQARAMR